MAPMGTAKAAATSAASQSVIQNDSPARMTSSAEV
jgi:hypothetical protein